MKRFVNLTPHDLTVRTEAGDISIPATGIVARVISVPGELREVVDGIPVYSGPEWGEVNGLPEPDGRLFIVSGIVAGRCKGRHDVVSPGTGPNDHCIRENGRIVAATRFIQAPKCDVPA